MFKGFKYPFTISAAAGRVAVERDYNRYVKGLIRQVLLTNPGDRINRPEMGGGVRSLVFAALSDETATIAQASIYNTLKEWLEAFIQVEDVRVETTQPSTLSVTVIYLIRATNEQTFLNLEVTE